MPAAYCYAYGRILANLKWLYLCMSCDMSCSVLHTGDLVTAGKHKYDNTLNSYKNITQCFVIHNVDKIPILLNYLLTYLLTPWSRVLLEKLTVFS